MRSMNRWDDQFSYEIPQLAVGVCCRWANLKRKNKKEMNKNNRGKKEEKNMKKWKKKKRKKKKGIYEE